jgi:MFS family permease
MDSSDVINFLDSFIGSSLTVIVPLFLVYRKIDIVSIGLILSFLPLVFLISRLIFASLSDMAGIKKFFILNALTNIVSTIFYLVANSTSLYLLAKAAEGVSNAAIWAVNRTLVALKARERPEVETSKLQVVRTIAASLGTAAGGLLIFYLAFDRAFIVLTLIGVVLLLVVSNLKKESWGRIKVRRVVGQLDFRKKNSLIQKISIIMIFRLAAIQTLTSFVLPLFINQLSSDYLIVGMAIAIYYLFDAGGTYFFIREQSIEKLILLETLLFVPFALLVPFAPKFLIFPFIMMLAVGDGIATVVWETLIMNAVKGSRSISTDIALIHAPSNFATALALVFAGFVVNFYGYGAIFALIAVSFLIFSYFSLKILKS